MCPCRALKVQTRILKRTLRLTVGHVRTRSSVLNNLQTFQRVSQKIPIIQSWWNKCRKKSFQLRAGLNGTELGNISEEMLFMHSNQAAVMITISPTRVHLSRAESETRGESASELSGRLQKYAKFKLYLPINLYLTRE